MPEKMKFLSLLKNSNFVTRSWPSCQQPRTLSFKALANTNTNTNNNNNDIFKTIINSTYTIDPTNNEEDAIIIEETPESIFIDQSLECASFSTASELLDDSRGVDPTENVIRSLRSSDRLFFELDDTSSIFEAKGMMLLPFKDSVAMAMDSKDPYVDFKNSMEEMVHANNVKDWEGLEELLCWYLKINGKNNHGYIVSAFVDLLVGLANASSNNSSSPSSSPLSCNSTFQTSSCSTFCVSSCIEGEGDGHTTTSSPSSSSLLLEQVKEEEITHHEDGASSSSPNVA